MATRKLKIKLTEHGRRTVFDGKLSQIASFRRAVRRAIATTKKNGNPVAQYDIQRRGRCRREIVGHIYFEGGALMSEMELKQMRELDEAAESAGGFLAPLTRLDTSYDYRALVRYCRWQ